MRNMSFFLTQQQIRERTKTVTRRLGWYHVNVGDVIQPVVKGQGLKKGEKVQKIGGPIRVVCVRGEGLSMMRSPNYGREEAAAEGFPHLTGRQFVDMFCQHNKCKPEALINRIEFEYLP
jgi:hypothetical protein